MSIMKIVRSVQSALDQNMPVQRSEQDLLVAVLNSVLKERGWEPLTERARFFAISQVSITSGSLIFIVRPFPDAYTVRYEVSPKFLKEVARKNGLTADGEFVNVIRTAVAAYDPNKDTIAVRRGSVAFPIIDASLKRLGMHLLATEEIIGVKIEDAVLHVSVKIMDAPHAAVHVLRLKLAGIEVYEKLVKAQKKVQRLEEKFLLTL